MLLANTVESVCSLRASAFPEGACPAQKNRRPYAQADRAFSRLQKERALQKKAALKALLEEQMRAGARRHFVQPMSDVERKCAASLAPAGCGSELQSLQDMCYHDIVEACHGVLGLHAHMHAPHACGTGFAK